MADFIVNEAGVKIYKDINKHEVLKVPVLSNQNEQGIVHTVLSAGFIGMQREPIITVSESTGKISAYRLPRELIDWVESSIGMKLQGIDMFPSKVEFGKLNNKIYAEYL